VEEIKPFGKVFGVTFNHFMTCNAKCSFCECWQMPIEATQPRYELTDVIRQMIAEDIFRPDATFSWGGGEPTILPEFGKLAKVVAAGGYKQIINTNGIKFSPELAELLAAGNAVGQISLDSGTPETYRLFKGRDVFPKVVENIRAYAANPVAAKSFRLKYIFANENCGDRDIISFIGLCNELNLSTVLSIEAKQLWKKEIEPSTFDQMAKLYSFATLFGVPVEIGCLFTSELTERLRNCLTTAMERIKAKAGIVPQALPCCANSAEEELAGIKSSLYYKAYDTCRKKSYLRYFSNATIKPMLRLTKKIMNAWMFA
jgi:organic radical activating enzyme